MKTQPQEIEEVNSVTIACKGSTTDISEGHPKVWLKIPQDKGRITCPYCDKTFVFKI